MVLLPLFLILVISTEVEGAKTSYEEIAKFKKFVIDELKVNIRRIHSLGTHVVICKVLDMIVGRWMPKEKRNIHYVCEKSELSFFWDNVHPSENGWYYVFKQLKPSLKQITRKNS
ncbi:unnamed protein product [Lupinus luteus]|uniref:Uncharacterized protein n=1 Tax=Lupinus luteus TaxID=3873 RepID=A0AAV1VS28_LUPLU